MKLKNNSNLFYPKLNFNVNKKFVYDPYNKMVVSRPNSGGGANFGSGGGCCGAGCCCCCCLCCCCCSTIK